MTGLIDMYILLIFSVQILLSINMGISIFYRIFRTKQIEYIKIVEEKKNVINLYLMILVSILMIFLFNPYTDFVVEVRDKLRDVLYNTAMLQFVYIIQNEGILEKLKLVAKKI